MRNIRFQSLTIILTLLCGFLFTRDFTTNVQLAFSEVMIEKEAASKPTLKIPKTLNLFIHVTFSNSLFSIQTNNIFSSYDVVDPSSAQKRLNPNYISLPPPLHS